MKTRKFYAGGISLLLGRAPQFKISTKAFKNAVAVSRLIEETIEAPDVERRNVLILGTPNDVR